MAGVRVTGLVKAYGAHLAVDHLDLEVLDGEFVTLLGPSGCGKTTTLRAIAGLVEIDAGSIWIGDRLMNDVPPNRRSAAMVFQSYALFPHMSVMANVEFGLRMLKVAKAERESRAREVMAMVGLEGLERRRPADLSGGQQQRVALARALVTRPDVLLFDEPLSNLDAKMRERLRVEIRELQKRVGVTSIYVTHDQVEAMVISDRIVLMNDGRIEQIGDPRTIYSHPATRFAAGFIGQVNIVEGTLVAQDASGALVDTPVGRLRVAGSPLTEEPLQRVSWRPEDMLLGAPDDGDANRISARLVSTIFMGNLSELVLESGGATLRAQSHGSAAVRDGEAVDVWVAADRIRFLA